MTSKVVKLVFCTLLATEKCGSYLWSTEVGTTTELSRPFIGRVRKIVKVSKAAQFIIEPFGGFTMLEIE